MIAPNTFSSTEVDIKLMSKFIDVSDQYAYERRAKSPDNAVDALIVIAAIVGAVKLLLVIVLNLSVVTGTNERSS